MVSGDEDSPRTLLLGRDSTLLSDEQLARKLQHEEELAADAQWASRASKRARVELTEDVSSFSLDICRGPLCDDAPGLLHGCLRCASDAARSEMWLCGPTPFYHQNRSSPKNGKGLSTTDSTGAVRDSWSCGYRNIQMLIGHLILRCGSAHEGVNGHGWGQLFGGVVPDIDSLQVELERLWTHGFDTEGRDHFQGRVRGTRRWIGTSEACVLLRGQRVRCNIESFRSGLSTLNAATEVMEYVYKYFAAQSSNTRGLQISPRPPLYFQHHGHSRTVIGMQRRYELCGKISNYLFILDPQLGLQGFEDFLKGVRRGHGWERYVKRSLAPLQRKSEYELLVLEPEGAISDEQTANARCVSIHV